MRSIDGIQKEPRRPKPKKLTPAAIESISFSEKGSDFYFPPSSYTPGAFNSSSPSHIKAKRKKSKEKIFKPETAPQKHRTRKIILGAFLILFLIFAYFGYFSWKAFSVGQKIIIRNEDASWTQDMKSFFRPLAKTELKPLKGEDGGRINILLLGAAGEGKPGKNLTDTVMIASIDTRNKKVALMSLPRDLYVSVPDTDQSAKINALYQAGLHSGKNFSLIREAAEKVLGVPIHYCLAVDFEAFQKIIDSIGGINVDVERDIHDTRYPGPNYSYITFELKKGFQKLDGETALKYVRERHDDPEGDFGRAKRQQQVIQAVKNKVFTIGTLLNGIALNSILDALGDGVKTDVAFDEIDSFVALSKEVDTQNIANTVVDAWKKDSLLKVSHIYSGNARSFILVPRTGNYSEIQELAQNIFDRDALAARREKIAGEKALIAVRNASTVRGLDSKAKTLLENKLGFPDVMIIPALEGMALENTTVIDNTERLKPYTLDELLKKMSARLLENQNQSATADEDEKYDFVVLLGKDAEEQFSMEEDDITREEYQESENNN